MKKFILTDETIEMFGVTLHRIKAVRSFGNVKEGDFGGFVENEENLSQDLEAWVYDNACIYGEACVFGSACVSGSARVYGEARVFDEAWVYDKACVHGEACVSGSARVYGSAWVFGEAWVYDKACVYDKARVHGEALVHGEADYIVFKNWWSSGRYFTWTRSNNMWSVGCFYGTGEELIKKAYADSEKSGREYERVVNFVQSILEDKQ